MWDVVFTGFEVCSLDGVCRFCSFELLVERYFVRALIYFIVGGFVVDW